MCNSVYSFVSEERLRKDILKTAEFGALRVGPGNGRTNHTGSEPNRKARDYLVSRLEDAGLSVRVDAVGNVVGRWIPEDVDDGVPAVATGSHLDSVTEGGIFDGVLGVYAGLEGVRAMQAADVDVSRPIEVVAFTEEEGGRFSDGVLGSSVAIGETSVEDALSLTDSDGTTLGEALEGIGFQGDGRIDAADWESWIELHVEQGTRLESADVPVGVVTDITGTIRCHIDIFGEADHAGTTSMEARTDALPAASELVLDLEREACRIVAEHSETAVGTVGQFDVEPGSINVIPGKVHLGIDIRDVHAESMELLVERVRDSLARLERDRHVETTFERPYNIEPITMADQCVNAVEKAADRIDIETIALHSGAGHDTMQIAKVTDAGLIFAPSRDGVSHSPLEWTDWSDCAVNASILAEALHDLASTTQKTRIHKNK
jgi:N-carbamoyl-L-amino-acid hydrolase